MYAIVRSGGRQERVAVGDVFELDRVAGEPGATIELPALLLVDGDTITSDAASLGNVTVTAEVVDHTKGPKIVIQKYKNKTGYKKRQGHRQRLTQVKITGIDAGRVGTVQTVTTPVTPVTTHETVTAPVATVAPVTTDETVTPVTTDETVTTPVATGPTVTPVTTDQTGTDHTATGE